MSTATSELVNERAELVEFRRQDAAIAKLAEDYMPLKIAGIDDKKGFEVVHAARMQVKAARIGLEKTRVALKADALAYGKAVDAEAKRLFDLIAPIEDHLDREENAVTEAKAQLKRAAEEAKRIALQKRLDELKAYGIIGNPDAVAAMDEAAFDVAIMSAKQAAEDRKREQEEAAAKRKAEEEALAKERAELEAIRKEQEAKEAALRAEQKKLDDERLARERAEQLEKAKAEAAEKARVMTEQRIAREAAEKKAAEEAAEAARVKAEAEKPYRERLRVFANSVRSMLPPVGSADAKVNRILTEAADKIEAIAKGPLDVH